MPRYVQARRLADGFGFYWIPPRQDQIRAEEDGRPFPFACTSLGKNLSQKDLDAAAAPLNEAYDEWRRDRDADAPRVLGQYGTVRWLIETYLRSDQFRKRVKPELHRGYALVLYRVAEMETKSGRRVGDVQVSAISARAADRVYERIAAGGRYRAAEKAVTYCRTAWSVVGRLYPDVVTDNPWKGVVMTKRKKQKKAAVDRATVYRFCEAAIAEGRPEVAAAAVICFEWLMRPTNVQAGLFTWADYDPPEHRGWVRIRHGKTGEVAWHPLAVEDPETGEALRPYADAEAILAQVPRRGVPVVIQHTGRLYPTTRLSQVTAKIAARAGIEGFSLDACRHGGLTELEEAGLTTNEGRTLSAHRSASAYEGYAKQTQDRAITPTLKRAAWRQRNARRTKGPAAAGEEG